MDISIIIPAYNEEHRIVPTILAFQCQLAARYAAFEIIVVDDGSTDGTVEILDGLKGQVPQLSVMLLPANKGKGHAVRQGMLAAKGAICMFADADGSTPATELDKLLAPLLQGRADVSLGSRYLGASQVVKAQPLMRILWSRLVNKLVQRVLLPGIVDTHCGFKAFTSAGAQRVFSACTIDGWSFDLEALAIARRLQLRVEEVPVTWANDERSKGRLRHLPRELHSFYRIRKRWAA